MLKLRNFTPIVYWFTKVWNTISWGCPVHRLQCSVQNGCMCNNVTQPVVTNISFQHFIRSFIITLFTIRKRYIKSCSIIKETIELLVPFNYYFTATKQAAFELADGFEPHFLFIVLEEHLADHLFGERFKLRRTIRILIRRIIYLRFHIYRSMGWIVIMDRNRCYDHEDLCGLGWDCVSFHDESSQPIHLYRISP